MFQLTHVGARLANQAIRFALSAEGATRSVILMARDRTQKSRPELERLSSCCLGLKELERSQPASPLVL